MGRQNERLDGLKMVINDVSYTLQSSYSLVDNVVVAVSDKTGERSHEKLGTVLYYMEPYSSEKDPMLMQLADFDLAQQKLVDAHKQLAQLVCDNKDFDFTKNISGFIDVIAETNALEAKIKATIQSCKAEMAEAIKDTPPSITVTNRPSGPGVAVEITGLDINDSLSMNLPKGFSRELVLELVMAEMKPSTLEAFKKAGRVIVDGKEIAIEDALTPKM